MDRRIYENKYFLPIIIAIVITISWVGVLDEYSDTYTSDSIIEAGASYAVARGINAAVSILQTTTLEGGGLVVGVSMTIGEMLDPINDLIERFSHVMSLALGSLVLQKILLGISAHAVFKLLIVVFGFLLIAALVAKKIAIISWTSRIFLILIFVRFSLVMVVSLNSIVDNVFITKQITSGANELRQFREEVVDFEKNNIGISAHKESIREDLLTINDINSTILPDIELRLAAASIQLKESEEDLEEMQGQMDWEDRWNPFNKNMKVVEAKDRIALNEQQIETLQSSFEEQEYLVEQLREKIEVSEKRLAGDPVGTWETIKDVLGMDYISDLNESLSFDSIEDGITETVKNIILLSVLFILKTILIPLVFFFIFIAGMKGIWKADLIGIIYNEEKLATERQ